MSETAVSGTTAATVTIHVPTTLRRFTDQNAAISVCADTAGQALRQACLAHPLLRAQIFAPDDSLRRFINVFVNARDIRHLQQEHTPLQDRDAITLLPAIAGG